MGTGSSPPGNHQCGSCSLQGDKPVFTIADCSSSCSRITALLNAVLLKVQPQIQRGFEPQNML